MGPLHWDALRATILFDFSKHPMCTHICSFLFPLLIFFAHMANALKMLWKWLLFLLYLFFFSDIGVDKLQGCVFRISKASIFFICPRVGKVDYLNLSLCAAAGLTPLSFSLWTKKDWKDCQHLANFQKVSGQSWPVCCSQRIEEPRAREARARFLFPARTSRDFKQPTGNFAGINCD